jgi:cytochrome c-type biogenesis protein CcmH
LASHSPLPIGTFAAKSSKAVLTCSIFGTAGAPRVARSSRCCWNPQARILSIWLSSAALAVDPTQLSDPVLQGRYAALTHELRCVQCQNQSIADSPVGLASDLRAQVRQMLLAGDSDEAVRHYMVARYGEFILFRPRYSLRNAWLWLSPIVLLLAGAAVALRIVRQREKLIEQDEAPLEEEDASPR